MSKTQHVGRNFTRAWTWFFLALVLMVGFLIRWRLRNCPLERDEGEYAYIGHLLLHGIAPYGVTGNHKFPGVYLAYAAIMAVFGETTSGIHTGMLVVNLASTLLLFFLGRRISGNVTGVTAAVAWVIMSVSPGVLGNAGHLTHLVVLAVLGGAMLLWAWFRTQRSWYLVAAGLCLGTSVVMRQTSLVFVVFGAVFVWLIARKASHRLAIQVRPTAMVLGGSVIPLILTGLWLYLAGAFPQFWRWTFTEAAAYGSQLSVAEGWKEFLRTTSMVLYWNWLFWIGAGCGLGVALFERSKSAWFLIGFLVAGIIALLPGLYFREHYYVQVLPAIALFFGYAIQKAWTLTNWSRYGAVIGFTMAVLLPLAGQSKYFLENSPTELARLIYSENPFPEMIEVAQYIRANSEPEDTVAVLGSEPELFFYAQRRSATSLIYTYPLMEHHKYAHEMQQTMAQEIEAGEPRFIVVVTVPYSWLRRDDSDEFIFDWAYAFLTRGYQLEGLADILAEGTYYVWGDAARRYRPQSPFYVVLYRRLRD